MSNFENRWNIKKRLLKDAYNIDDFGMLFNNLALDETVYILEGFQNEVALEQTEYLIKSLD